MKDINQYFNFHWQHRGGKTAEDPYIAPKIEIILGMIPHDVTTIMDIGCGDGAITNVLAKKYKAIGVDYSIEALKHLTTSAICSNADSLSLRDECADLALSSEMLEHLPDEVFVKALCEIKRVSKKYILITVPNGEKLRKRYTKCNICGFEFHIYSHLRSFNLDKLVKYFNGYIIRYSTLCGVPEANSFDRISYLKNKLANSYFKISQPILCPNCGSVIDFSFYSRNLLQIRIAQILDFLQRILNLVLNRKPHPYWLLVLLEKQR